MNTLKELIYDVRNILKLSSDDSNITNTYIKHKLNQHRIKLTRQRLGDIRRIASVDYKQEIQFNLESITTPDLENNIRSSVVIPKILDINSIDNRSTLASTNGMQKPFVMTSFRRLKYVGTRSHLAHLIYGAIGSDSKMYFNSGNNNYRLMNKASLYAIFEDPEEAYELDPYKVNGVEFWDTPYPIEPSLSADLVNSVVKDLSITFQLKEDKINDGEDTQS